MNITKICDGVYSQDGFCYLSNEISSTPMGKINGISIQYKLAAHCGYSYHYQKRQWKKQTIRLARPKTKNTLQEKIRKILTHKL